VIYRPRKRVKEKEPQPNDRAVDSLGLPAARLKNPADRFIVWEGCFGFMVDQLVGSVVKRCHSVVFHVGISSLGNEQLHHVHGAK
jgi:hypothetical protein